MKPAQAIQLARRLTFVALAVVIFLGLRDLQFVRLAVNDNGALDFTAGGLVLVQTPGQDGAWLANAVYLYQIDEGSQPVLTRLIGLPGERLVRLADGVLIGDREFRISPDATLGWPDQLGPNDCLLWRDYVDVVPDSRQLGPMPIEGLVSRVVVQMPF